MTSKSRVTGDKHRHHFVPQFYLRFFGDEKRIDLYHIPSSRYISKASIKHQCQREHFYGKDQTIEDALAIFEGHAAKVLRKIKTTSSTQLSKEERNILLQFILFQSQRTPLSVAIRQANIETFKNALIRAADNDPRTIEYVQSSTKSPPDPVRENLSMATGSYKYLEDLKIKLLVNNKAIGFITSDSPVVLFNQAAFGLKDIGALGWTRPGLQIFFPLSPQACLLLYDGRMYSVKSTKQGAVPINLDNDIEQINALQALSADTNLYFCANEQTVASISMLPFNNRVPPEKRFGYINAKSPENPNKVLIGLFLQQLDFKLDISVIRMHESRKSENLFKRIYGARPLVAQHLGPAPSKKRGRLKSVRYEIVRDLEPDVSYQG